MQQWTVGAAAADVFPDLLRVVQLPVHKRGGQATTVSGAGTRQRQHVDVRGAASNLMLVFSVFPMASGASQRALGGWWEEDRISPAPEGAREGRGGVNEP